MGLKGFEIITDRPERIRRDLYLLTVEGHDIDSSVLDISLSDLCHALFFLLYMLKIGVGFCSLLCSVVISDVLPGRFFIKTLTLSLIWYLSSVLKPLLYFGYHLMETINNYTSSSERFFVEEIQNGTFATFFCDVFSPVTITSQ